MPRLLIMFYSLLAVLIPTCLLAQQDPLFQKIPSVTQKATGSYEIYVSKKTRMDQIPDTLFPEHTPMRHVRVCFHYISHPTKGGNFDESMARDFTHKLIAAANEKLLHNTKMNLPLGNNTPVVPTRFEYVLTGNPNIPGDDGIYFHQTADARTCWWLSTDRGDDTKYISNVWDQFGTMRDTVLNIFFMSHPPDSANSPYYKCKAQGIGYNNYVKMAGPISWYESYKKNGEVDPLQTTADFYAGLMNHECGHSLGLLHTWLDHDFCDDTPLNPGCWNYGPNPPCDKEVSNNVMDYNAYQNAYTPCQLSFIHDNFLNPRSSQRKLLDPTWCTFHPESTINIPMMTEVEWKGDKDLEGNIEIHNKAVLKIDARVSLPAGAKIIMHPGSKLILDNGTVTNVCGQKWGGVVQKNPEKPGTVEIIHMGRFDNVVGQ